MPTFSEVSPLITCLARKNVFAVSTSMCVMLYYSITFRICLSGLSPIDM
jgi:hypothetical protein